MGVTQRKCVVEAGKELAEVVRRKHGWSSSTQIECAYFCKIILTDRALGLCYDGADEGLLISVSRGVFVKGAVGADPMTEGDMNVDNQKIKSEARSVENKLNRHG
jgi:hypothetical protein